MANPVFPPFCEIFFVLFMPALWAFAAWRFGGPFTVQYIVVVIGSVLSTCVGVLLGAIAGTIVGAYPLAQLVQEQEWIFNPTTAGG